MNSDSSTDRQAVAIPTADIQVGAAASAPVVYLRIDDEPVTSPFDALAATVDPAGRLVAAVAATKAGDHAVTIWDPETEETVEVAAVEPAAGITWTDDDQIVVWSFGSWQVIELT